ncbi:hypothetical protein D3C83_187580 [compost metagenome]
MQQTIEPARCAPECSAAQPTSPRCSNVIASAENAEKEVMPPRKPVITNSRHAGAIARFCVK